MYFKPIGGWKINYHRGNSNIKDNNNSKLKKNSNERCLKIPEKKN